MGQKPYILAFSPLHAQYVRVCFVVYCIEKKITTTLDCYFRKTVKIESFALRVVILIVLGTLWKQDLDGRP